VTVRKIEKDNVKKNGNYNSAENEIMTYEGRESRMFALCLGDR
jgi:hypothetical protein